VAYKKRLKPEGLEASKWLARAYRPMQRLVSKGTSLTPPGDSIALDHSSSQALADHG
jgi:hypothetical protein